MQRELAMDYQPQCPVRPLKAALALTLGAALQGVSTPASHAGESDTATPIKHLIVIIGENHTFDNLFAGFKPHGGQGVKNLLSEGIIKKDGSPGPNFTQAAQQHADARTAYSINPQLTGPYASTTACNDLQPVSSLVEVLHRGT
jgi:phospholipase C